MTRRFASLALVSLTLSACSTGVYGHSRIYAPLPEEEDASANATKYDPVMASRDPEAWKSKTVTLFGVVTARTPGKKGTTDISLSLRNLEPRNLCDTQDEDSCRVTVSDRAHAIVQADVQLSADDDIGQLRVGPGSLLRVVGRIRDDVRAGNGNTVISVNYYRHWPRGFYVTTAARQHMRR